MEESQSYHTTKLSDWQTIWQLFFAEALAERGLPAGFPPDPQISAVQVVWTPEFEVRVNQEVERPKGLALSRRRSHLTMLRCGEDWEISFDFLENALYYESPWIWAEIVEQILPAPARRRLSKVIGGDWKRVCGSTLFEVLTTEGSSWALRNKLEVEGFGSGVLSPRAVREVILLKPEEEEGLKKKRRREQAEFEGVESRVLLSAVEDIPGYKEALLLEEGYSQEEIAQLFGIDQTSVSRRIKGFLKAARKKLSEGGLNEP